MGDSDFAHSAIGGGPLLRPETTAWQRSGISRQFSMELRQFYTGLTVFERVIDTGRRSSRHSLWAGDKQPPQPTRSYVYAAFRRTPKVVVVMTLPSAAAQILLPTETSGSPMPLTKESPMKQIRVSVKTDFIWFGAKRKQPCDNLMMTCHPS